MFAVSATKVQPARIASRSTRFKAMHALDTHVQLLTVQTLLTGYASVLHEL